MITLGVMGGLGAPEILILGIIVLFFILCPAFWLIERSKRKFWQAKAQEYERRLLDKITM